MMSKGKGKKGMGMMPPPMMGMNSMMVNLHDLLQVVLNCSPLLYLSPPSARLLPFAFRPPSAFRRLPPALAQQLLLQQQLQELLLQQQWQQQQ